MRPELPRVVPRRRVLPDADALVTSGPLAPGQCLPFVFRPSRPDVDLISWTQAARSSLSRDLHKYGALLFRGFSRVNRDVFANFAAAVSGPAQEYLQRSSPRQEVGNRIYTSTEQPPDEEILLHNEHSYSLNWPMRLLFFCEVPPVAGGATPLADSRRIHDRISPETRTAFSDRTYAYVRHCRKGLGLDWTEIYQTSDRAVVEEYCRSQDIQFAWRGDCLMTTQIRPLVRVHPATGEPVWFNHMLFFNVTALSPDIRAPLVDGAGPAELPNNTYYGDGAPIEPEVIAEVRAAYEAERVRFDWQEHDILLIDNMLVSHGRESFKPPRRILVAMTEPYTTFVSAPDGL